MADEKFRQLIMRELDDMKTKLDALARKDLLCSISFLKEGLTFLNLSQDESTDGETSYPQLEPQKAEGATMSMIAAGSSSVFNEACSQALSKEIGKSNIVSGERFTSAKLSFQEANKKATEAFSNEALAIEDRILATKLRVISRILQSLEDPAQAAAACKLYLEELHCLPAVQEMFSVYFKGGMKRKIKSLINPEKRHENVMSVIMINFVVFDFTKKFTKMPVDLLNWSSIELGKSKRITAYNPMIVSRETARDLEYMFGAKLPPSNSIPLDIPDHTRFCENSKGEIIVMDDGTNIRKITAAREVRKFCCLPPEDTEVKGFEISSLAIDGADNVYILTRCPCESSTIIDPRYNYNYKLFVLDAEGNIKHQSPLQVFDEKTNRGHRHPAFAVTKDGGKIITHRCNDEDLHVCDSSSGELKYSFPMEDRDTTILSISDESEIIAASEFSKFVYIYTEEGNVKRKFELPKGHQVLDVAFNHVNKEILLLTDNFLDYKFYFSRYSKTGEKRQTIESPIEGWGSVSSHPSGPVVLVTYNKVIYIQ